MLELMGIIYVIGVGTEIIRLKLLIELLGVDKVDTGDRGDSGEESGDGVHLPERWLVQYTPRLHLYRTPLHSSFSPA